jgi:hypothetical protein
VEALLLFLLLQPLASETTQSSVTPQAAAKAEREVAAQGAMRANY